MQSPNPNTGSVAIIRDQCSRLSQRYVLVKAIEMHLHFCYLKINSGKNWSSLLNDHEFNVRLNDGKYSIGNVKKF